MTDDEQKPTGSPCCPAFSRSMETLTFDKLDDGLFAARGCCGGCYVFGQMRFCPFCGAEIGGGPE